MRYFLFIALLSLSAMAKDCHFRASEEVSDYAIKIMQKRGCQLEESSPNLLNFEKETLSIYHAEFFGARCPYFERSNFIYTLTDTITNEVIAEGQYENRSLVTYDFEYTNGEANPKNLIYCEYEGAFNHTIRKAIKSLVKNL